MTIFCEPDGGTAAGVVAALEGGEVHAVADLPGAAVSMSRDPDERLVVLGSAIPFDDAICFADEIRAERPDVTVVLIREHVDADTLADATAAGIHEVLAAGDDAALAAACDRIREHHAAQAEQLAQWWREAQDQQPDESGRHSAEPPVRLGHVLTVFSPKGGAGTTAIATNLALLLSSPERRVCLLDLSLEFGDVAIALRLSPSRTIADVAALPVDADPQFVVDSVATAYRDGLDCVLAPVNPGDAERVGPSVVAGLLRGLRMRYDYVVVDTPSRFSEQVLEALDVSSVHVLVTTPDISALKSLRLTLDTLDLLEYPRERRAVLLNRADGRGELGSDDVAKVLGAAPAGRLPVSADVSSSLNAGQPLAAGQPAHPLVVALREFATATVPDQPADRDRRERRRLPKIRRRSR